MSGQSFRKTKTTFSPHTIIKNKLQINDLNVINETINVQEENMSEFCTINLGIEENFIWLKVQME